LIPGLWSKFDPGIQFTGRKMNPGSTPDLLRKVAVQNWFRYTRFRPETESGVKTNPDLLNTVSVKN